MILVLFQRYDMASLHITATVCCHWVSQRYDIASLHI